MLYINGQSNSVTVQKNVLFAVKITGMSGYVYLEDSNPIPDEDIWQGDVGNSGSFSFQLIMNANRTMNLVAFSKCIGDFVCLQQSNPVHVIVGEGSIPPTEQITESIKWIAYIVIAVVIIMIFREYKSFTR